MLVAFSEADKKNLFILGLLVLVFLGAALYSNILHAPFVFDDYNSIVDNDTIKNLSLSLRNFSDNRYLTNISFSLNYKLGELKPFGYHLINNLIHIINTLLVYYLILLIFKTPQLIHSQYSVQFIAFSSAFLFIAHPIQTQAVTYISQRSVCLSSLFYLLSFIFYTAFRLAVENMERVCFIRKISLFCFLLLCIIFAMKSKEIAFTLPLMIILYEYMFFAGTKLSRRLIYLLPVLMTILIIPLNMVDTSTSVESIIDDLNVSSRETLNISREDYLFTQFRVILTYLRLLVFPVNQSVDYDFSISHSLMEPAVLLSFAVILAILFSGICLLRGVSQQRTGLKLAAFGIFWFFITLSIESSIIPIKDVIFEHRVYLPSIGFFFASVTLLENISSRKRMKVAVVFILVGFLSVSTYMRNELWRSPETLWEDVIEKHPNHSRALINLGVVYKNRKDFDKANEYFEKSLVSNKNYTAAYYNLGDIQFMLGNYKDAIFFFNKTLSLKLSTKLHLDTLNSLGISYSEMGEPDQSVNTFKEAVRLFPNSLLPYNNLGMQYIKMGKADMAIEVLKKALEIRESPNIYYNLSKAYALLDDTEKSRIMREKALFLSAK